MQVDECKEIEMTRDMDLIRDLMLYIESDPIFDGTHWITFDAPADIMSTHSIEEINYHVRLLTEAGFVRGNIGPIYSSISKLTWQGHEFLDSIKDKDVWQKTKERVKGLPGVALSVIGDIAKAEIKKKLNLC